MDGSYHRYRPAPVSYDKALTTFDQAKEFQRSGFEI
jgi:hypothetical protein